MMPIEAKFQSYVAFVARSRLQIPPVLRLLSLFNYQGREELRAPVKRLTLSLEKH